MGQAYLIRTSSEPSPVLTRTPKRARLSEPQRLLSPLLHFHGREGVAVEPRRFISSSPPESSLNPLRPPNEAGQAQVLPLALRKLERGEGRGEGTVFFGAVSAMMGEPLFRNLV